MIHLLRHYSEVVQITMPENRSLTYSQLQQAIDYIHAHLNRDLSLAELASVVNISPTYFASLFIRFHISLNHSVHRCLLPGIPKNYGLRTSQQSNCGKPDF